MAKKRKKVYKRDENEENLLDNRILEYVNRQKKVRGSTKKRKF